LGLPALAIGIVGAALGELVPIQSLGRAHPAESATSVASFALAIAALGFVASLRRPGRLIAANLPLAASQVSATPPARVRLGWSPAVARAAVVVTTCVSWAVWVIQNPHNLLLDAVTCLMVLGLVPPFVRRGPAALGSSRWATLDSTGIHVHLWLAHI